MGHIATVDFTGYYTFDLEGMYSSYCGQLEYFLDPTSSPSQTYLTYDGAYLLTLAPLDGQHSDGTFQHVLRARLVEWPDRYHDTHFDIELYSCKVQTHYADSVAGGSITPGDDEVFEYVYVAGLDDAITFDFSFGAITTNQGQGCESIYEQRYTLHDTTGTDITATLPNYITAFDSTNGSLTLFTVSTDDKGFQTV